MEIRKKAKGIILLVLMLGTSIAAGALYMFSGEPTTSIGHISQVSEKDYNWAVENSKSVKGIMVSRYKGYDHILIRASKSEWQPVTPRANGVYWVEGNSTLVVPLEANESKLGIQMAKEGAINYNIEVAILNDGLADIKVTLSDEKREIYNTFKVENIELTDNTVDMTPQWNPLTQYPPQRSVVIVN